jgi:RES domain
VASPPLRFVAYPPDEPPAKLPPLIEQPLDESWRLHWEPNPLKRKRHKPGLSRFDAPRGEYAVTYVNEDRMAPFAEVYGDQRVLTKSEASRRWSRIEATRPLRILQLDAEGVAAAFGLDLRIATELDYERTQAWSLAWHDWYGDAEIDGIRYLGRKAMKHLNYCLYLDRCGTDLDYKTDGKLIEMWSDGLRACARHGIVPELYF